MRPRAHSSWSLRPVHSFEEAEACAFAFPVPESQELEGLHRLVHLLGDGGPRHQAIVGAQGHADPFAAHPCKRMLVQLLPELGDGLLIAGQTHLKGDPPVGNVAHQLVDVALAVGDRWILDLAR